MITIELTAAIDAAGTIANFYAANEAYATLPTDTPANTALLPSVKNSGDFETTIFADGIVTGGTELKVGEIVLSNANGQYDSWKDYGFGGRPVVVRQGAKGAAYPAGFAVLFTGYVDSIYVDRTEIRIRVKDPQALFEKPVLTTAYAGNNALPSGAEGGADIKGALKPMVWGAPFNTRAICVNTSKAIYQAHNGALQDIAQVYDRGASLTKGVDNANLAALEAATVGAGTYQTCLALGLFRLGSAAAGTVTCNPVQGANVAARTVAQVLKALALAAGVAPGDIDAASVTALDTANAAPVGMFIDDETTYAEAMDMVANSIGAYYGFEPNGKFVMGVLLAPTGTSLLTIGEFYAGKKTERRPLKDVDIPAYRVIVNHSKSWTVQTDLAASVPETHRAKAGVEYRSEIATDASVQTQFLDAQVLTFETLLTVAADAATEAARRLALHKVKRDAFEVPVPVGPASEAGLRVGPCVTLQINRFGLSGGKLMRVLRVRQELAKSRVLLTVWG